MVKKFNLSPYNLLGFYENFFILDNKKKINSNVKLNFSSHSELDTSNDKFNIEFIYHKDVINKDALKTIKKFSLDRNLKLRTIGYLIKRELDFADDNEYFRYSGDKIQFTKRFNEDLEHFNTLKIKLDKNFYQLLKNKQSYFDFFIKFSFFQDENSNSYYGKFKRSQLKKKINITNFSGRLNVASQDMFETFLDDESTSIYINLNPYYQKIDPEYKIIMEELVFGFNKSFYQRLKLNESVPVIKKIDLIENQKCRFKRQKEIINFCSFSNFNSNQYIKYDNKFFYKLNIKKIKTFFDHSKLYHNLIDNNQSLLSSQNNGQLNNIYLDRVSIDNFKLKKNDTYFTRYKQKLLPSFLVDNIDEYYNYNFNITKSMDVNKIHISNNIITSNLSDNFADYYKVLALKFVEFYENEETYYEEPYYYENYFNNANNAADVKLERLDKAFTKFTKFIVNNPFRHSVNIDFFDSGNTNEEQRDFLKNVFNKYYNYGFDFSLEKVVVILEDIDNIGRSRFYNNAYYQADIKNNFNLFAKIKINNEYFEKVSSTQFYIFSFLTTLIILFSFLFYLIFFCVKITNFLIDKSFMRYANNFLINKIYFNKLIIPTSFLLTILNIYYVYQYYVSTVFNFLYFLILLSVANLYIVYLTFFSKQSKAYDFVIFLIFILVTLFSYSLFINIDSAFTSYLFIPFTFTLIISVILSYYFYFFTHQYFSTKTKKINLFFLGIFTVSIELKIIYLYNYFDYISYLFFDLITFSVILNIYNIFNIIFLKLFSLKRKNYLFLLFIFIFAISLAGNILLKTFNVFYLDGFNILSFSFLLIISINNIINYEK